MTQPNPSSPLWPTDWQGCRIQAQYLDLAGVPIQGTVTFTASPVAMLDYANKQIVVPKQFTASLDVNGRVDIVLPATDDPDINPNGWTYAVSENFSGGRKYNIEAPQNTTIDLSQVAPVPTALGVPIVRGPRGATGGIQSVNGHSEPYITTLSASDVGADPLGAATTAQSNAIGSSLQKSANLNDLASLSSARSNLGLIPDATATAATVALRDANGRTKFNDPAAAGDASTKAYTDLLGIPKSTTGSLGYPTSPTTGQYADDSSLGLVRYNGSVWQAYSTTTDQGLANNYIRVGSVLIMWGSVNVTVSATTAGTATVTLPISFSNIPRVTATGTGQSIYVAFTNTVNVGSFNVVVRHIDATSSSATVTVHWHAFGQA